jgi:hypothetical protein
MTRASSVVATVVGRYAASSSNNTFASLRSRVSNLARFALVRRLRPAGWEACQARLETGLRAGAELNGAEETDGREQ